jgi:hypothetical protein
MAVDSVTTLMVVALTVVVCLAVWVVCVCVMGLSKQASTAVLNAGGYISKAHSKDEPPQVTYAFDPKDDRYEDPGSGGPRPSKMSRG